LILVFHHSIGDGYSLLYLITNAICGKQSHKNVTPNYLKRGWFSQVLYCALFPFLASWELAGIIVQAAKHNLIRASLPSDKQSSVGPNRSKYSIAVTKSLDLSLIKNIKSHFDTSFSAVECSALCLALRDLQLQKDMVVSNVTPFMIVAPYPGHTLSQLQNHMYANMLIYPTKFLIYIIHCKK